MILKSDNWNKEFAIGVCPLKWVSTEIIKWISSYTNKARYFRNKFRIKQSCPSPQVQGFPKSPLSPQSCDLPVPVYSVLHLQGHGSSSHPSSSSVLWPSCSVPQCCSQWEQRQNKKDTDEKNSFSVLMHLYMPVAHKPLRLIKQTIGWGDEPPHNKITRM